MPSDGKPESFRTWAGWDTFVANTRNIANHTTIYTGKNAISPLSSTILQTITFPTAAGATCAKRCKANPYCGSIEMYVERTPSANPAIEAPNPAPAYSFVCRLHNKVLAASDAKFTGRNEMLFNITQTAVTILSPKGWRKVRPKNFDGACSTSADCGAGLACDGERRKCAIQQNGLCSSSMDSGSCVTGNCGFNAFSTRDGPPTSDTTPVTCVVSDGQTPKDKPCTSNAACASGLCLRPSMRCADPVLSPNGGACVNNYECQTGNCAVASAGDPTYKQCAPIRQAQGAECFSSAECQSNSCVQNKCGPMIIT